MVTCIEAGQVQLVVDERGRACPKVPDSNCRYRQVLLAGGDGLVARQVRPPVYWDVGVLIFLQVNGMMRCVKAFLQLR